VLAFKAQGNETAFYATELLPGGMIHLCREKLQACR